MRLFLTKKGRRGGQVIVLLCGLFLLKAEFAGADTIPEQPIKNTLLNSFSIDSLWQRSYIDSLAHRFFGRKPDPAMDLMTRSALDYAPYAGKIVRSISTVQSSVFNFNSGKPGSLKAYLTSSLSKMNPRTRSWVIRQSLFFHENKPLDPYELADNARYLRSLPFMREVKLLVYPSGLSEDSVDVVVITQDKFAPGLVAYPLDAFKGMKSLLRYGNVGGWGQSVSAGLEVDTRLNPATRYAFTYTKYNVQGSFIDLSGGYSDLKTPQTTDTGTYESTLFLRLNRPFYAAKTRFAGGLELRYNTALNVYKQLDTLFRDYRYGLADVWMAYALNRLPYHKLSGNRRDLSVLAVRHLRQSFMKQPDQAVFNRDPDYNDLHYSLVQFSFFREENYTTSFYRGFGRTEDIPLGRQISFSVGYEQRPGLNRIYLGSEYRRSKVWGRGFSSVYIGLGAFLRPDELNESSDLSVSPYFLSAVPGMQNRSWPSAHYSIFSDISFNARASFHSRLFRAGKLPLRHFVELAYLNSFNPGINKPTSLEEADPFYVFRDDFIYGYRLLSLKSEWTFYSVFELLGFRFNLFSSLNMAQLGNLSPMAGDRALHTSFSSGFNVRNESLNFNALRVAAWFNPAAGNLPVRFGFKASTMIDLRSRAGLVRAPSFVKQDLLD